MKRIVEGVGIVVLAGAIAALAAHLAGCKPVPPLPPEPPHTVTLGDASFSGDCIEVSWDVLDALNCPESLHDKALYRTKAEAIGYDFDFCAVAACHDTDCVHAHGVRCQVP